MKYISENNEKVNKYKKHANTCTRSKFYFLEQNHANVKMDSYKCDKYGTS